MVSNACLDNGLLGILRKGVWFDFEVNTILYEIFVISPDIQISIDFLVKSNPKSLVMTTNPDCMKMWMIIF